MKFASQRLSTQCENILFATFHSFFHLSDQNLLGTLIQSYILGHYPVLRDPPHCPQHIPSSVLYINSVNIHSASVWIVDPIYHGPPHIVTRIVYGTGMHAMTNCLRL